MLLSVPDEDILLDVADVAYYSGAQYTLFVEPDLDNEHTAMAVLPSPELKSILSRLPLLFREEVNANNGF